jgi:phosphatidylserine synthase
MSISSIPCKTNINNDFNNVLFKSGFLNKDSKNLQNDRKNLFQFVCLPFRFGIALLLVYISDLSFINIYAQNIFSIIILSLSLYHLQTKSEKSVRCQWWDNKLEVSLLYMVLLFVVVGLFYEFKTLKIVSLYMMFSIFIGLLQSVVANPFDVV